MSTPNSQRLEVRNALLATLDNMDTPPVLKVGGMIEALAVMVMAYRTTPVDECIAAIAEILKNETVAMEGSGSSNVH